MAFFVRPVAVSSGVFHRFGGRMRKPRTAGGQSRGHLNQSPHTSTFDMNLIPTVCWQRWTNNRKRLQQPCVSCSTRCILSPLVEFPLCSDKHGALGAASDKEPRANMRYYKCREDVPHMTVRTREMRRFCSREGNRRSSRAQWACGTKSEGHPSNLSVQSC